MSNDDSKFLAAFRRRLAMVCDETTPYAVSKRIGVSHQTLYNWLSGSTTPSLVRFAAFCSVLDIDANWLLFGDE